MCISSRKWLRLPSRFGMVFFTKFPLFVWLFFFKDGDIARSRSHSLFVRMMMLSLKK